MQRTERRMKGFIQSKNARCWGLIGIIFALCFLFPIFVRDASAEKSGNSKSREADLGAYDVVIDEKNFPDEYFQAYVYKKFDTNKDGVISEIELCNVKQMYITDNNISSIKGVENFLLLEKLELVFGNVGGSTGYPNEKITEIDVSNLQNLKEFKVYYAQNLRQINLQGCTALETLLLECTSITELDVNGLSSLKSLKCRGFCDPTHLNFMEFKEVSVYSDCWDTLSHLPRLRKLHFEQCTQLLEIDCRGNELTEFDVSACAYLSLINVIDNKLTELDVSKCRELSVLYCSGNELAELDISQNEHIWIVDCSRNKLSKLITTGTFQLSELDCRENNLETLDLSESHIHKGNSSFKCDKDVKVKYPDWYVKYIVLTAIVVVVAVGLVVFSVLKKKKRKRLGNHLEQ